MKGIEVMIGKLLEKTDDELIMIKEIVTRILEEREEREDEKRLDKALEYLFE